MKWSLPPHYLLLFLLFASFLYELKEFSLMHLRCRRKVFFSATSKCLTERKRIGLIHDPNLPFSNFTSIFSFLSILLFPNVFPFLLAMIKMYFLKVLNITEYFPLFYYSTLKKYIIISRISLYSSVMLAILSLFVSLHLNRSNLVVVF